MIQDFAVEAALDQRVVTVPQLSWTTDEPGLSWVEFGVDGSLDPSTPIALEADTVHAFTLLGVPSESEVSYRAVTETESGTLISEGTVTTGVLPEDIPAFLQETDEPALRGEEPFLVTAIETSETSWLLVINRDAKVVWYEEVPNGGNPYTIEQGLNGQGLLYSGFPMNDTRNESQIFHADVTDRSKELATLPWGHHAFTQLPGGAVAWIAADIRPWTDPSTGETTDVAGDAIHLLELDGRDRVLFSTWDWAEPRPNPHWAEEYFPGSRSWTHANGLNYDPVVGTLLFSLRNPAVLLEVDVRDGFLVEEYGLIGSQWHFAEGTQPWCYQHDPNWTEDGNLLMISTTEGVDAQHTESVIREYRVDREFRVIEEVWSYGEGLGLHARYHGAARELQSGNRLLNFGSKGVIHEVTGDGELAWAISAHPEGGLGSTLLVDDLYSLAP